MDWFSWLSKTGLDPTLVYEYGLAFAYNDLGQDDIPYFNHEFLQSMGIAVAKHRLEILKLAGKHEIRRHAPPYLPLPVSRILTAVRRAKRSLSNRLRAWIRRDESPATALAVVPRRSSSGRWKNSSVAGNKASKKQLLLTNGSSRINSLASSNLDGEGEERDSVDEYWSSAVEEIRWDTMFQNLKPT